MLSTLKNAWKVPELRKRMLFTLFFVAIYRLGSHVPVPGINTAALTNLTQGNNGSNLFAFYDLLSGGSFSRFSIFAMGVTPYINASIIFQLLTIAIPYLENLSKEGEDGRKKIQNYTRYSTVILGAIQAIGTYAIVYNAGALKDTSRFNFFLIALTLTTASVLAMWLGEQLTLKGIGNGVSLLIFVGIISRFPSQIYKIASLQKAETVNFLGVIVLVAVIFALLLAVIVTTLGERRIPVQYAGKVVGSKTFKGQTSHIPIGVNTSGVIAIIFAMSVMQFPATIGQFWPTSNFTKFISGSTWSPFRANSWQYALIYFVLILFFSWFYTQITFKPDEMAENMHKSSGFIPGIRPGEPTARYLESILTKVSILGGTFASVVAIFPIILEGYTNFKQISLGGTSLLIMVGVALESMKQLQAQLVMRHYQGFLK